MDLEIPLGHGVSMWQPKLEARVLQELHIKPADRVLEVGGLPAKKAASMIASVRQQPAGTWLPLRVQRGDQSLEVVIKFPPKP